MRGIRISEARAARAAASAAGRPASVAHVDAEGRLRCEHRVGIGEAGLRRGRRNAIATMVCKPRDSAGAAPEALLDAGAPAVAAHEVDVPRDEGTETVTVRLDERLEDLADADVELVSVRVRSKAPAVAAALLATLVVAAAIIVSTWGDPRARRGYYDGKTPEEIRDDLDSQVDWYSMEISVAATINVREGETEAEARIENVANNHCDQKVRIYPAGDPDDVLYQSGAIAPGEYIQYVELAHPLEVGTHQLTVEFQGYERGVTLLSDEGQLLGHDRFGASCAAEITLNVLPADVEYGSEA